LTSNSSVRTLVVDDSAAVRASLTTLVEADEAIRVIGTAEDGREAIDKVEDLVPDLVLMDLQMPVMNGLDATKEIQRRRPAVHVIVVTTHDGQGVRAACESAGADGFVSKTAGPQEILNEIRRVVSKGGEP
jgi:DNA-binding NarL/FixJ family response regulator